MLESRDAAGMTPAEAVAAGGAALDRVLAMIDDCEWRLRRAEAEGKATSMLPDPDELRRRLGIPERAPSSRTSRCPGRRRPRWTSCGCRSGCWLIPEADRRSGPTGVWHEGNPYARPAVIIVAPGGPAEALPVLN